MKIIFFGLGSIGQKHAKILLNDYDLINEVSTFIQKGNSYEAEIGAHDDLMMCCVLFAWATNQTFFKDLKIDLANVVLPAPDKPVIHIIM